MNVLPNGWISGPLSDFIQPRRERVSTASVPELPFIGMDHVEAHTTRIIGSVPAGRMKSRAARFSEHNVLYGRLRPYLNKVAQPAFDGLASAEFIVFSGNELIDPRFLFRRLNSRDFVSFASHLNEGDRPRVSFDQIGEFRLLVPPLDEQRRIVDRIEVMFAEIERGVESLRTAKRKIGLYRQSLLKSAFEGRLTAGWRAANPDKLESPNALLARIREERERRYRDAIDKWEQAVIAWRKGGDVGRKPQKPKRPKDSNPQSHDRLSVPATWVTAPLGGIAFEAVLGKMLDREKNRGKPRTYLGNVNLRWGSFDVERTKKIPIEDHEVSRYCIRAGDLIVCEGGEPGRCAVWQGEDNKFFFQKALHRVRLTQSYAPWFAYYFLKFATTAGFLNRHYTGSTIKHLTGTALADVLMPICPLAEQIKVIRILDAHFEAAEMLDREIETNLIRAEALRQSILKRAFSGQLVVQDPNEEPAGTLLARIRSEALSIRNTPHQRRTSS